MKDHHHLKTKVWPEYLGINKYVELKQHLDGLLNCQTQVDFNKHQSDLYKALSDRPKDVQYFEQYLDYPESIARYKIVEVTGIFGTVLSSNADAGHASNEDAVPTQLLWIVAIETQILKLLERKDR